MKLENESEKTEYDDLERLIRRLHPDAKYKFIHDASNISDNVRLALFEVNGYFRSAEEYSKNKVSSETPFYEELNKYYYFQEKKEE